MSNLPMPNCPTCGSCTNVRISTAFADGKTHYCWDCAYWFWPQTDFDEPFEHDEQEPEAPTMTVGLIQSDPYPYLDKDFLRVMNEIFKYGDEKYKDESFHARKLAGVADLRGPSARTQSVAVKNHAAQHFIEYSRGLKHDHFGTLGHQLAACAGNAMMEFVFAKLGNERTNEESAA